MIRDNGKAEMQAIGAGAVNQAIKAVAIARSYLVGDGLDLVVVPVRFGGGPRLQVLEAMAQRVPIVTPSVGCEGLGVRDGVEVVVVDDPVAFARACDDLLGDPVRRGALAAAAAELHAASVGEVAIAPANVIGAVLVLVEPVAVGVGSRGDGDRTGLGQRGRGGRGQQRKQQLPGR